MTATSTPSAGELFRLVQSGRAESRADLSRLTGLSASTVALRVEELIAHGYLEETGRGVSKGGRRPRMLAVSAGETIVAAVDLGERHMTIVLMNRRGEVLADTNEPLSLLDGPQRVLADVWEKVQELARDLPGTRIEGIAMSLPGPVDSRDGRLLAPMRMPGWNGVVVADLLREITGLPAHVDNDANAMAMGEFVERGQSVNELVFVKAGSGIGCGVIVGGELYRGYRGVAGDISHVALAGAPPVICSCGRVGCLDVVASGAAIVDALRESGIAVDHLEDVLALAADAHPRATGLLREAGQRTGEVLATIINFFNPRVLAIGGRLATADAFIAGVRQAIYTLCLPMSTDLLEISVSAAGPLGGARGVGDALLAELLEPERIDRDLRLASSNID
ncbi:ROK family protein [Microbacterium kyungheense]|uniref:Putative NBD/HSP70 family sugar kinase n=1 Tax=Microbacterium kyungheense TaxID=1263636 RepID=A0A543FJY4_9MICO|nr:ROK family protein [Microbacterium kyungheense]TQM34190.1 putative NBD/HSP70 family sugar kinase [Microbacterium kyungheense]